MSVNRLLRAEGLAVFLAATAAYVALGGAWWLYLVLAFAPDVGMVGYLASPTVGARTYNALHTYIGPVALGALGVYLGGSLFVYVALVWTAHIGADRAIGYGLKYATGFSDTHVDRV